MDIYNLILVFIILTTTVIILALLISDRVRANIHILGKNKFSIEASRKNNESRSAYPKPKQDSPKMPTIWFEATQGQWKSQNMSGHKEIYLGTGPQSTIRLRLESGADELQSRIYWNGQRYKICNLSRRTPTIVNNKAIKEQNLGDGNKIQVGNTILIFRLETTQ